MARSVLWPLMAIALLSHAALVTGADRFVAHTGTDASTCASSATPCRTVAYAVGQAASGDEVKIAAGRYTERVVVATSPLGVSGGWSGDFAVQDPVANLTRLRGSVGDPLDDIFVIETTGSEAIALTLDGLTLSRAKRGIFVDAPVDATVSIALTRCAVNQMREFGIAILANGTSAITLDVADSAFSRNIGAADTTFLVEGPAALVSTQGSSSADVSFIDTRFERNRARGRGGALFMGASGSSTLQLDLTRCVFERNQAPRASAGAVYGIAVNTAQLDVLISGSTFARNRAMTVGGLQQNGGTLEMVNTAFVGNVGRGFAGGAAELANATSTITNCTFTRNKEGVAGGVIVVQGSAAFRNSIFWDNSSDDLLPNGGTITAEYCDIEDGVFTNLGGNISVDPLFVAKKDPHIDPASPCRNAGTCTGAPADDIDGDPRPSGGGCDIGADEVVP